MPYTFPGSPSVGTVHQITAGDITRSWVYDGKGWMPGAFTVGGVGGVTEDTLFEKGNVSGTVAINWSQGTVQRMTVTGNVTGWTFTGWPASGTSFTGVLLIDKENNSTVRTFAWGSIRWPVGGAPFLAVSEIPLSRSRIVLMTENGGAAIDGALAGNWTP